MRAVKLPARVNKDHTLHLELPEGIREGPAEVIVLVSEPSDKGPSQSEGMSLEDYLARPRVDRQFILSKEEIDDYLRAGRDPEEPLPGPRPRLR